MDDRIKVVEAIIEPLIRVKLIRICEALDTHALLPLVNYGISGLTMLDIQGFIEATQTKTKPLDDILETCQDKPKKQTHKRKASKKPIKA